MNIKLIKERNPEISFIDQILQNRGIDRTAEDFFNLDWDCIEDPFNLDYINEAIELYNKHILNNSRIAVLVDVDADGFTSAAVLINYTKAQIAYGEEWKDATPELIPVFHKDKTHGLGDTEMMRRLRDEIKPNLLVVPDASGTSEQYKALTDIGIDVLVLDHHDMSERGNGINVVVVNNQQSKNYKNKDFSGVGIVWQFCRALDSKLTLACSDRYIDLVAIGNIGDVMSLQSDETRFLCRVGLHPNNILSEYLGYLKFTEYGLRDKSLNPNTVGFNITPKFNAVCRIGSLEEKEMLFKCLLDDECQKKIPSGKRGHTGDLVPLLEEGCRLAANACSRQNNRKAKLISMIDQVISEEELFKNQVIILAFDDFEEEYRALSGLVCNGLLDYYDRPIILTFKNKDGSYSGSFRAPDKVEAYANFKDQCRATGLCTFVEGHQLAAGIGIKKDCVEALNQYFNKAYKDMDTDLCEKVDFVFDANDPELVDCIEELAIFEDVWGTNLEAPKIAINNVKIGLSTMDLVGTKKNTLKINLPYATLINFKSSQSEYDSLKLPYDGVEQYYLATVVCDTPAINEYRDIRIPQLQFSSYKLGPIRYDF